MRRAALACGVWHDKSITFFGERFRDVKELVAGFWKAVNEKNNTLLQAGLIGSRRRRGEHPRHQ
jgi:hypothetical protein